MICSFFQERTCHCETFLPISLLFLSLHIGTGALASALYWNFEIQTTFVEEKTVKSFPFVSSIKAALFHVLFFFLSKMVQF
jgi:hypothetical protein